MKMACVTGASGFIGHALCNALTSKGVKIVTFDRVARPDRNQQAYEVDITRPVQVSSLRNIDTIFHLAGKAHALSERAQDDDEYALVNTIGTRNMLEAAKSAGVRRFVFFSTIKAMSNGTVQLHGVREPSAPMSELDDIAPDTAYGRSKLEAEKLVLRGDFVPEPVVLRLCMVYGAGAKGNIQKMLRAVSRHRFPPLPRLPSKRSMVHVQDVIQAALLAAGRTEAIRQTYIVSDGKDYHARQIFQLMCKALDRPCPRWAVPLVALKILGRAGDLIGRYRQRRFVFDSDSLYKLVGSAWYDSRKIRAELGFTPEWDLERALPEMVTELRHH